MSIIRAIWPMEWPEGWAQCADCGVTIVDQNDAWQFEVSDGRGGSYPYLRCGECNKTEAMKVKGTPHG